MLSIDTSIPSSVQLGVESAVKLRALGYQFGETATGYLNGSIGVVGLWGFIAQEEPATSEILYGITDGHDKLHVFDMQELLAEAVKLYKEKVSDDPILDVPIPARVQPYLKCASEYYATPFRPLLSLAIGFRKRCLEGIGNGETFHYSTDGWQTDTQVSIERIKN
jgi:hypothetical protein